VIDDALNIYGAQDIPLGIQGRPLVSFAVFAYNQEDFIREAVLGAFSQTYSPLEIILSDDCSSDRTFEIMEKMAAAYSGPHRVIVRRNEARDDISFPERTELQVGALIRADETVAVISGADIIYDANGDISSQKWYSDKKREYYSKNKSWFLGATACYRSGILKKFHSPGRKINFEDAVFTAIFENIGLSSLYMDRPVILRRFHQKNISMERTMADPWSEELRVIRRIGYLADALDYAVDVVESSQKSAQKLRSQVALMRRYVGWPNMGVLERFRLFIDCLRVGRMRKLVFRILLGKKIFIWLGSRIKV